MRYVQITSPSVCVCPALKKLSHIQGRHLLSLVQAAAVSAELFIEVWRELQPNA